jgi:amino acid transporter
MITGFDGSIIAPSWSSISGCLPFIIFVFAGFEASCSISQYIENPEKNASRAIYLSFAITLLITTLYQLSFNLIIGDNVAYVHSFIDAFPVAIQTVILHPTAYRFLTALTLSGVATSSLGSSYSIMYSNIWNLYHIGREQFFPAQTLITYKNKSQSPIVCVGISCIISIMYLLISNGNHIPLQQIGACGVTITYSTAVIGFFAIYRKKRKFLLPVLSVLSCLLFYYSIIKNAYNFGAIAYGTFLTIVGAGFIVAYCQNRSYKLTQ